MVDRCADLPNYAISWKGRKKIYDDPHTNGYTSNIYGYVASPVLFVTLTTPSKSHRKTHPPIIWPFSGKKIARLNTPPNISRAGSYFPPLFPYLDYLNVFSLGHYYPCFLILRQPDLEVDRVLLISGLVEFQKTQPRYFNMEKNATLNGNRQTFMAKLDR